MPLNNVFLNVLGVANENPVHERPMYGCQVIVQSEEEKNLRKAMRKEEKRLNKLLNKAEGVLTTERLDCFDFHANSSKSRDVLTLACLVKLVI